MYVKNRMTKQPVCIDVNSKISQVVDIMNEKIYIVFLLYQEKNWWDL